MTSSPVIPPGVGTNQALARGLYVLRRLVESSRPMSATELAKELGLHQSSVSRVLATLTEAGYVRKDSGGRFVPDYGVITLAAESTRLPLLSRPQQVIRSILQDYPSLTIATTMLWRSEMIYLARSNAGGRTHLYEYTGATGFPLNQSSPGLRLLLDLPEAEALRLLAESRKKHGWGGDPAVVPQDEQSTLEVARKHCQHDVLLLDGWVTPGELSGAIPVDTSEPHPVALAIVVDDGSMGADELRLLLHRARRELEIAFRE